MAKTSSNGTNSSSISQSMMSLRDFAETINASDEAKGLQENLVENKNKDADVEKVSKKGGTKKNGHAQWDEFVRRANSKKEKLTAEKQINIAVRADVQVMLNKLKYVIPEFSKTNKGDILYAALSIIIDENKDLILKIKEENENKFTL